MRVLLLSSSTGGGHDMRAAAFQAWAERLPKLGMQTELLRPLDSGPAIYRFGVGLYNWIQRTLPALHHLYFNFLEVAAPCRSITGMLGKKAFCESISRLRPDVIVSVHGSLNHGYFELARWTLGRDRVRCITYCGELFGGYGFSRNWVNPAADLFIGAVPETLLAAQQLGMPSAKMRLGGFWLRPMFYEAAQTEIERERYIREELRLDPSRFILLLSASSRGANNHRALLHELEISLPELQVVVLCGKSADAEAEVRRWQVEHPSLPIRLQPFDSNIARLMRAVSAVVVRPGTGATSEAILSQCPLILNCLGGAMPQEWITVKYCRHRRIAETISRPAQLSDVVRRWQAHPEIPKLIRERMAKLTPAVTPTDSLRLIAECA